MFDVQAMNANNVAYAAGALPDVIDLAQTSLMPLTRI